ncbi:hypothetical protein [Dehalobacter sp. TeCB1]|uniref:hypothetical protein n=1 Tax=Dehalobacter sp. TeCB1 TaxID=1843715 RepID=UPI000839F276|nr:hypothetical protein [Dehalobacter sp. TeCB1]OCZ53802.1 hypothetical protein A7D23_07520 [Dehalobacter sp. TeCB1]
MVDRDKMKDLIQACRELDINDPAISEHWDLLVQELGTEDEAIDFLKSASDKDLSVLSPVFEDLSLKFQSNTFVEFLKDLEKNHPAADMKLDVEFAEKALAD